MDPYIEGYNPCIDDEWIDEEYHRRREYRPVKISIRPPWGNLDEMYPGQHQGKPFGNIQSNIFDIGTNTKEEEVDKTYHPKKLTNKQQEKQDRESKLLEEFLKKDKPLIEELWKEHQKKVEEFNKIWSIK